MRWPATMALVLSAGCGADAAYHWDEARVLCSVSVDDKEANWDRLEERLQDAEQMRAVAVMHAHVPGETIQRASIERIFHMAEAHHLDYVTFDELVPGESRPGIAFAFDDSNVDSWYSVRDILEAHHARITLFVARWYQLDDATLGKLAELSAAGHDLEPHSVNHLHAPQYVNDHGLDAYLADEVLPSIQIMIDAGYHPTTFAFPFSDTDLLIDQAVLEHIPKVRTGLGSCPY